MVIADDCLVDVRVVSHWPIAVGAHGIIPATVSPDAIRILVTKCTSFGVFRLQPTLLSSHLLSFHATDSHACAQFHVHEDRVFCDAHFEELFLKECATCRKVIRDRVVEDPRVLDRYMHPLCWTCMDCGCLLSPDSVAMGAKDLSSICARCFGTVSAVLQLHQTERRARLADALAEMERLQSLGRRRAYEVRFAGVSFCWCCCCGRGVHANHKVFLMLLQFTFGPRC